MNLEQLKTLVTEKIEEGVRVCEEYYGTKIEMPEIVYDLRGTIAGQAMGFFGTSPTGLIRLNKNLLIRHEMDFINDTPLHELAHLINYMMNYNYGDNDPKPHGPEWKYIVKLMGQEPKRCHSFNTEGLKKKTVKYEWVCSVCGTRMLLGKKRHNRMLNAVKTGVIGYYMKGCRNHLYTYKGLYKHPDSVEPMKKAAQTKSTTSSHTSKKDRAKKIFKTGDSRTKIIDRFMTELNMSKAGASTYYHNFYSGNW